jgi:hypothetical protein
MVTDGTGLSATATIKVVDFLDELEINPKVATLSPGGQITFVATGGNNSSYEYSFQTNNSGGTINSATGLYTAGPITGVSDTIIVTDADLTECAIPANISVVAAVSNVDYDITLPAFPPSGYIGDTISGTFTITNLGPSNGNKPVSWWLYLSDDGSFATGGETLIATNSTAKLDYGGSVDITPSGTWPMASGTFELLVMISAEDDMNHGNNVENAGVIQLGGPKVDYRVTNVEQTSGEKVPGASFTGRFLYDNAGTFAVDDGISALSWEIYLSLGNTTLEAGDELIDSGSGLSPMNVGAPSVQLTFSGTWPLEYGDYYFIATITTGDDEQAPADNKAVSSQIPLVTFKESTLLNDNWTALSYPGTDFDILEGQYAPDPIALAPGMRIVVEGTNISNDDRDDVYLFNTGTANLITFTVQWNTAADDIDLYVWKEPGGFGNEVIEALGYTADLLSASIALGTHFVGSQYLWLNIYCHIPNGPTMDVGPYTITITVE